MQLTVCVLKTNEQLEVWPAYKAMCCSSMLPGMLLIVYWYSRTPVLILWARNVAAAQSDGALDKP